MSEALIHHTAAYSKVTCVVGLQLSILRIFHQMLGDAAFRKQPSSGPLLHFCTGIVRNLFARLAPPAQPAPSSIPHDPAEDHGGAISMLLLSLSSVRSFIHSCDPISIPMGLDADTSD